MRNPQVGFLDYVIPVQNQIQIERPGGTWVRTIAAAVRFDCQQEIEQLPRRHRRMAGDGGVQKARLRADANRLGFVNAGDAKVGEVGVKAGDREREVRLAISQVAAERDGDGCYCPTHRVPST
jgi:hypothetical protein